MQKVVHYVLCLLLFCLYDISYLCHIYFLLICCGGKNCVNNNFGLFGLHVGVPIDLFCKRELSSWYLTDGRRASCYVKAINYLLLTLMFISN